MSAIGPAAVRPHAIYDPRLRDLVFHAGDVAIARDCGIPRSDELRTIRDVERLVAFFVDQHNTVPHSSLKGQTPDEVYTGTAEHVAAELAKARARARQAQIAKNRAAHCSVCPDAKYSSGSEQRRSWGAALVHGRHAASVAPSAFRHRVQVRWRQATTGGAPSAERRSMPLPASMSGSPKTSGQPDAFLHNV